MAYNMVLIYFALFTAFRLCPAQMAGGFEQLNEVQRHFEFEDALSDEQQDYWVWRSEASNLKALRLEDPDRSYTIEFMICIEPLVGTNSIFRLDDIRYANDGPTDNVFVSFDGAPIATYETFEKLKGGYDWNVFRNSGPIGAPLRLAKGMYPLQVTVMTDQYGIELDKIRVNVENQDPDKDVFCGASVSFENWEGQN